MLVASGLTEVKLVSFKVLFWGIDVNLGIGNSPKRVDGKFISVVEEVYGGKLQFTSI